MSSPIRISYNTLRSNPTSLKDAIQAGLGSQPGALGVVIIEGESGLPLSSRQSIELTTDLPPSYPSLRSRLLRLAATLAALPDAEKAALESPETTYSFGWSHGKEVMNGVCLLSLRFAS